MSSPKIWFITGSSSGFGRCVTELVLKNGDIAVATLRKPEVLAELSKKYPSDKLLVLKLDVQNKQEIINAFSEVEKKFGRIDVVFNNAGYSLVGEVEGTEEAAARALFDVNFWAAANVSREAIRFFREVNKPAGGRLLQNTSMVAIEGSPAFGFYSASKSALEALSESLAGELDPDWNIKITLIEPGAFRTDIVSSMPVLPLHPAYTKPTLGGFMVRKYMESGPPRAEADQAAEVIYGIAELSEPPLYFPLGKDAVAFAKKKAAKLQADVEKFGSLSDGLDLK